MKYKCGNICGLALLTLLTGCSHNFNSVSASPENVVIPGTIVTITATCYNTKYKSGGIASDQKDTYNAVSCESNAVSISPTNNIESVSCAQLDDTESSSRCLPGFAWKKDSQYTVGNTKCGVYTFIVKAPESYVVKDYKLTCKTANIFIESANALINIHTGPSITLVASPSTMTPTVLTSELTASVEPKAAESTNIVFKFQANSFFTHSAESCMIQKGSNSCSITLTVPTATVYYDKGPESITATAANYVKGVVDVYFRIPPGPVE